ncbi:hypothetical protein SAMN04490204_4987 [Pseudomonas thivervalensis]|nr:hypothetical protein SAMN04490204_4987 [Pseudomonas thivervalensis]
MCNKPPSPTETNNASPDSSLNPKKLDEAAKRALEVSGWGPLRSPAGAGSLATFETAAQSSPNFFNRYRIDRNDNFNRCAAAVRFQRVSSNAWRMSLRSTSSR